MENIQIVVAITCQGMCTSFFIFECTIGCDIVYYYVYQEDEGKEGGKNAVSRLVDNFKDMGYFSNSCMGELIIWIGKFGGQKKNSIVIWFIIWII